MSLIFYGMLAYFAVLGLRTWRARTAVVFGATLFVLLIGFSRMYLGVHYFSNVVAGRNGVPLAVVLTAFRTSKTPRPSRSWWTPWSRSSVLWAGLERGLQRFAMTLTHFTLWCTFLHGRT
jgi:membrane-associated phospholipid phosphatase